MPLKLPVASLTQSFTSSLVAFVIMESIIAPSADAYDADVSCWFLQSTSGNSSSSSPPGQQRYMQLKCPQFSYEIKQPAFCCGTELAKTCCEWTIYVINYIGGGHTDIGVGVLVGVTFLLAVGVFCLLCAIFHFSWVRKRPANSSSRPTSAQLSIRHGIDSRMPLIAPSSMA